MEGTRLRVAIIYGGRSAEHEVSLRSAASVFGAADRNRYELVPILITKQGSWYRMEAAVSSFAQGARPDEAQRVLLSHDPTDKGFLAVGSNGRMRPFPIDVVIPVLHGTYGEDGTIQGLLDLADLPYVGCGVTASSLGMDKILMKGAFREAGLEVGPFFWFLRSQWRANRAGIVERLKHSCFPVFVKPANLGSSVGISRVDDPSGFAAAVEKAASFDRKVLVEDGIVGRELEVSVLGNEDPQASLPGEVVSHSEFYDYDEKYLKDTAELIIPAALPDDISEKARSAAVTAFKAVDGSGLARVDMFVAPDGRILVNEINTLPGFTSISMYPKLWEVTGISYPQLIDRMVELALERHRDRRSLRTDLVA
ncbi:MAG: D-alanine--D-alanine ligase family protein [Thermodesulfobacteriota bacterium]